MIIKFTRLKFYRKTKKSLDKIFFLSYNLTFIFAGLAQLVEQLPCKQQVGGSSPLTSSIYFSSV